MHFAKKVLISLLATTGLAGCNSVEIPESALFTNARALGPRDFPLHGHELEELSLARDGATLYGWRMHKPGARTTHALIYFGGQGFHLGLSYGIFDTLLPLLPPGCELYVFDHRGYGRSTGEPSVAALSSDAEAIWAHVAQTSGLDADHIGLHGHSMGTFLASKMGATVKTPWRVILEAPVTNTEDWLDTLVPGWVSLFVQLRPAPALKVPDNLTAVAVVQSPMLIVAGEDDKISPPVFAKKLSAAAPTPPITIVVEGGGHNDLPQSETFRAAYRSFLAGEPSQ